MKKGTLEKISRGKYYVEGNSTYKKDVGKLCNFRIADIVIYEKLDKPISFEITLKKKNETRTELFPISYLRDPISWLYCGFDTVDFRIESTNKEFETSMIQIINMILKHNEYKTFENYIGWNLEKTASGTIYEKTLYFFGKFEDPGIPIELKSKKGTENFLFHYIKLADISITAPLLSYMLLSLLTNLRIFGTNAKACFNVALVGGSEELRRKFALFTTNLYKRDSSFCKNEYKFFHINKGDTFSDMRLKAAWATDCVLIAFEPDKKHLKNLLCETYSTNVIDDKQPIENLLLFTGDHFEKITNGNTLVIKLDSGHNTEAIENFFKIDSTHLREDYLIDNIYYYIKWLTERLTENRNYVREKFIEHCKIFGEKLISSDISQTAWEVAQVLSFAFSMYAECFNEQDNSLCGKVYDSILNSAKNSFPAEGTTTDDDFEEAKAVCKQIDSYFDSKKTECLLGIVGCEKNPSEKRIWCDDEHIYIRRFYVEEFLILTGGKLHYNKKISVALADKSIIKTFIKKDNHPEYSVHLQKKLRAEPKSKGKNKNEDKDENNNNNKNKDKDKDKDKDKLKYRYIAFNREICKQYNLFENIEEIILNRCQKDVKKQKKKKTKKNKKIKKA